MHEESAMAFLHLSKRHDATIIRQCIDQNVRFGHSERVRVYQPEREVFQHIAHSNILKLHVHNVGLGSTFRYTLLKD